MTTGLEKICLSVTDSSCAQATSEICLFGAHITSWQFFPNGPAGEREEYLWMSTLSTIDGTAPIRGGIPIAFPQFADNGPMKLHGFAREKLWTVVSRRKTEECDEVQLSIINDTSTAEDWNYPCLFYVTLTVELRISSLTMRLSVHNSSDIAPMPFTGCFHTYFRTPDIYQISIQGLQDLPFIDKVDEYQSKLHPSSVFRVADEMIAAEAALLADGQYFVDRIYQPPAGAACSLTLTDFGADRQFVVDKSSSWPEWVVFNPWVEGKRGIKCTDFDDDGYKYMMCLEPAVATKPVIVPPGDMWVGEQVIHVTRGLAARAEGS